MNDENMRLATETQKKITVKLKPVALKKATSGETAEPSPAAAESAAADIQVPSAPEGASPSATVKFNKQKVAESEPELPSAQDLAKQTLKLSLPPKSGLPKPPPPATSAAPAPAPAPAKEPAESKPDATQAVRRPTLTLKPKAVAAEPGAAPVAADQPTVVLTPKDAEPKPDATQAVKKPGLSLKKAEPAAPAEEAPKKPSLSLTPKTAPDAASPTIHLQKMDKPENQQDAATIQAEGLKPRASGLEGGNLQPKGKGSSGLGLKKVEAVAEEELPENLKADGKKLTDPSAAAKKRMSKTDEPGGFFTAVTVFAFIFLLIGAYVMFAQYAGLWMPEMDAYTKDLPELPTGIFLK